MPSKRFAQTASEGAASVTARTITAAALLLWYIGHGYSRMAAVFLDWSFVDQLRNFAGVSETPADSGNLPAGTNLVTNCYIESVIISDTDAELENKAS